MCTKYWKRYGCACIPELMEMGRCPEKQKTPSGPCAGTTNAYYDVPNACNKCRIGLKKDGLPIERATWI
jgi:hypothetical protein